MSKNSTYDYKCPSCNAILKFDPHGQNWKCEYCKHEYNLEELKAYNEKIGRKELKDEHKVKLEKDYNGMDIYTCNNCGAQIVADENTSATFCVYCKNTAILKNKLVDEFNPDYVIPFKFTKEDAIEKFRKIHKPLMPKIFNNPKNIEETKGIYIPFWLYDYNTSGIVDFHAERVTSWTSGQYHYTKTDTYAVKRGGSVEFYNLPVDGSKKFDNSIMNSIEPFNYADLKPFNHSYLSGFLAEKYDVNNEDARSDAENRASNSLENVLKNDVKGYTSVRTSNKSINNVPMTNKVLYAGWAKYDPLKQVIIRFDKDVFVVDKDSLLPLSKYDDIHNEKIATINFIYNNKNYKNSSVSIYKKLIREFVIINGEKYKTGSEYKFSENTKIESIYKEEIIIPNMPSLKSNDFIGFFTDPINGRKVDNLDNIYQDTTLYARFNNSENIELMTLSNENDKNNEFINLLLDYNYDNIEPKEVRIPTRMVFKGWTSDNIVYHAGDQVIKEDIEYKAKYEPISIVDNLSLEPVREGYVFTGWYTKPVDGILVDLSKVGAERTNYALLPVWLLNVNYKGKLRTFAMNGQTGKLIGDIPVDLVKAIIWWVAVFSAIMAIFVILYLVGVIG